jgi:hypothetical protein
MEDLINKIKGVIKSLNEKGIPTPIMRDMVSGKPSITYTMLVVSFALVTISSFKVGADTLGLNFKNCLELLSYVGIGYIGRKYQKGDTTIQSESEKGE